MSLLGGEMACIGSSVAHCVNSTWKAKACTKGLFCFALPNVREEGTVLSCTTNATALAVINASGATGSLAVLNGTDDSIAFPTDCDDDDEQTTISVNATATHAHHSASQTASFSATGTFVSSVATSAAITDTLAPPAATGTLSVSATDGDSSATAVTVTVTATVLPTGSQGFSTDFSETTTLDASQAASFLSSIATDTNFSVVTTIRASATVSDAVPTFSTGSKPVGIESAPAFTSDVGAPTTITLLARPTGTGLSSSAVAVTSSAAAVAVDAGDSYYH
ncbi:hypothetical protein C2E23DRAFT_352142 [Lenzites betulinus]|nr:hypothetical protein C2E23DRAFT_352142 [Lenzites betulinus]